MAECFSKAWGFFQRDLVAEWDSRFSLVLQLINIVLTLTIYIFLSRFVEGEALGRWSHASGGYFPFVLIGMATNGAMITAVTGLSRSLQVERSLGVLKPLFFSQTRPEAVLLLSSLYPLARAGVDLFLYLFIGWTFGGFSLSRANLPGAALVSFFSILAFASVGLWAAAFSVLFRFGNPFLWVVSSSSWLLGGVLYPTPILPVFLQWSARLIPLTHSLEGMRAALLYGAGLGELLLPTAFLAAFTLLAAPLGVAVFCAGLKRAQVSGTLAN